MGGSAANVARLLQHPGTVAVHLVPGFGSCTPNTISITTNLRILSHVQ
jgi:hypothetical protein